MFPEFRNISQSQSARDSLGEVKLLHREYGTAISALASEKRTCSKEVRRMHEQLTSLDSYAGELHELIVKENAKRKVGGFFRVLATRTSCSSPAHDYDSRLYSYAGELHELIVKENGGRIFWKQFLGPITFYSSQRTTWRCCP